jgi:hypothetical protein
MALVGVMLILMLILAGSLVGVAKMSGQSTGDLGSTSNNTLFLAKKRLNVMQAESLADTGLRAAVQWISERPKPPIQVVSFTPLEVTPDNFFKDSGRVDDANKWTVVKFPVDPATPNEGEFKVRFYPHSGNAKASQRSYVIESVGTFKGEVRVARADIRQKTFAQYAYFTDEHSEGSYFIAGKTPFNGPVHINNSTNKRVNIIWDSNESNPSVGRVFQWNGDNAFTMWGNNGANNNTVDWHKDRQFTYSAPSTNDQWQRTITPKDDGTVRKGPVMVGSKVDLPVGNGTLKSVEQRDAALGGYLESSVPSGNGVYVPSTGGINAASGTPTGGVYIKGQVDDMVLEAAGTGNRDQIMYIYQDNSLTKWKVTMTATGTTRLEKFTRTSTSNAFPTTNVTSFPKTYSGVTNGVIYSYDNIGVPGSESGGLSGTVANSVPGSDKTKLNICTRVEGTIDTTTNPVITPEGYKSINIDGNLVYANANRTAAVAPTDAGVLGLVAGQVHLTTKSRVIESGTTGFKNRSPSEDGRVTNGTNLTNMAIHATVMAYDRIMVDDWATRTKGEFRLLGGYIARIGSPFGQVLGGNDPATMFNVTTGLQRILSYDRRVADEPPPFFPGTGQVYEAISYQRVLAPLQP